jgi:hypothetical protein
MWVQDGEHDWVARLRLCDNVNCIRKPLEQSTSHQSVDDRKLKRVAEGVRPEPSPYQGGL